VTLDSVVHNSLVESLTKGFIDKTKIGNNQYLPKIVVNDKINGRKVLTSIQNQLNTCDTFWFSVAFATSGGVSSILQSLIDSLNRKINGKILLSNYLSFTQPEALRKLLKLKNIDLKVVEKGNFHSKGYLFEKDDLCNLIIGSSNLTQSALSTNKEWNLQISASKNSGIFDEARKLFQYEFDNATQVTDQYINSYEHEYSKRSFNIEKNYKKEAFFKITPNIMQEEALRNLNTIRLKGKKKALLISATGTGKTYLSAFDAENLKINRLLFIVHRENIARKSLESYKMIFGESKTYGIFSGDEKDTKKDFIFSTIQTLSKKENIERFNESYFDYIIIDESHRAGANSYQTIFSYFKPKFLLGMTATPERSDGFDIFKLFDYNIAYEIRLHKALEMEMLCPFHYFGITDLSVNGREIEEKSDFSLLVERERIERIIEISKLYGTDSGIIHGLVFCSRTEEARNLSEGFNQRGYNTIYLTGSSTDQERSMSVDRLESVDTANKLDYIFTVDIFNEGVDIPKVNQIILLRSTKSIIVFIQQIGRGLRKTDGKQYLTILDFIGNYDNNYLVPIALYGDTSFNKDKIRKLIVNGNNYLSGCSTVNFDRISKEKIFKSIDTSNLELRKDLVADYDLLKYKLGNIPMSIDFIRHSSRDPQLYINYSKSYFNFICSLEKEYRNKLDDNQIKLLELFSSEINNSKRIEESIILKAIIDNKKFKTTDLEKIIKEKYGYVIDKKSISSFEQNLNFKFVTQNKDGNLTPIGDIYNFKIVTLENDEFIIDINFANLLQNNIFKAFLLDNIITAILKYENIFKSENFINGFTLYNKYSRKDVFRILNWSKNPNPQNVGGYIISEDKSNCPIFVNYHKEEDISSSTKYDDGFINKSIFKWMSKNKRNLSSPDITAIRNYKSLNMRIPLFIKKNNDEGSDFYYVGEIYPIENSFEMGHIEDDNMKKISVVKVLFELHPMIDENLYIYITQNS
jgi:superfamily II DNA or RNA helicase/HKD family nuclease